MLVLSLSDNVGFRLAEPPLGIQYRTFVELEEIVQFGRPVFQEYLLAAARLILREILFSSLISAWVR